MSAQTDDQLARDRALAKKGRTVSLVIAGSMLIWLASLYIGPRLGISVRYAVLIDLLALAALLWGFIVSMQIWRARKTLRDDT